MLAKATQNRCQAPTCLAKPRRPPKPPFHPTPTLSNKRCLAPISKGGWHQSQHQKGGWHQSQKLGGTNLRLQNPAKPPVTPNPQPANRHPDPNFPDNPKTPSPSSTPNQPIKTNGAWHQSQKVGGTNLSTKKVGGTNLNLSTKKVGGTNLKSWVAPIGRNAGKREWVGGFSGVGCFVPNAKIRPAGTLASR
jgi:hypothetical protein